MKVRYTETALIEVDHIFAYISERNRSAATRVVARIERAIEDLGQFPKAAQETGETGVRRKVVGRYPYIIFYTVEAVEVVILHVRPGARRWPWEDEP